MRLSHAFLFTFLFAIICPQLIAEPPESGLSTREGSIRLTLEDCISQAKENNLQLLQTKMDIDQARAGVTDANSSYYPSLGLSSGYRYGGDFTEPGTGSFSTGINAQYTFYKGGSIRAGTKIAKTRVKIAEENYRQKENEVVLSVKQAFFKILQTQEQISLINNVLKRRNENLTLIKLNYNVGRENEPDVKQAEVSLNQTEYDYMKAEQGLSLAKLGLNRLLNRSDEEIAIKYEDRVIEFPGLDTVTKMAKEERPEIISEKANREVLQAQISQAKSNYLPAVSVSSSYGYGLQGDTLLKQKANWSAGINLSLPLFNGFSTSAKVRAATISLKQNDFNLLDLTNNIEQEVKQAYSDWQLATKNLEVSSRTLEATRAAYQLTKLQYEQGRTSYFFLQQKESDLTQAENGYVNSQYNLRASTATLEKALGRSSQ
jgi:outer membrane protein